MTSAINRGTLLAVIGVGLFAALPSSAGTKLICENPRREYLVIYEPGSLFVLLNPDSDSTKYKVIVDDNSDGSHIVTTETIEGGPTARLHLRPYQKMEIWSGGQLIQTDACYVQN